MRLDADAGLRVLAVLYAAGAALVTVVLAFLSAWEPAASLPTLAVLVPAGALCWRFAVRVQRGVRLSLDGALLIAAVLLLPPLSALLTGALVALAGSALQRTERAVSLAAWKALANVGIHTLTMTAGVLAARLARTLSPEGLSGILLGTVAVFLALQSANLLLLSVSLVARRQAVNPYVRAALSRVVSVEAATVPLAAVLVLVWTREGILPGALLAASLVVAAAGLQRLERLRAGHRTLSRELTERASELETLGAIGRRVSASLDADAVYDLVEREVTRLMDADVFLLALVDPEGQEVDYVRHTRDGKRQPRRKPVREDGAVSWVRERGTSLVVDDALRDRSHFAVSAALEVGHARAILAVPLLAEGRVMGVLSVQSRNPGAYQQRHERLLRAVAQQAAVAIENARHYRMATIDRLTGLYLREPFERRLREEDLRRKRYGGGFGLLMIDLDDFKQINDRFGHAAGDRLLRAVGDAVRRSLRSADVPCRWGGEEICVLLPETDRAGVLAIAERIRDAVRSVPAGGGARNIRTTASIGAAAVAAGQAASLAGLLRSADRALYEAKARGKDQVVWAENEHPRGR